MKKELSKGSKIAVSVLVAIVVVGVMLIVSIILSDEVENKNDVVDTAQQSVDESSSGEKTNSDVLYADDNFEITFVDFKDPKLGVTSYNLLLKIENNSDQTVIVSPSDGYANDEGVFLGSGMPVKVKPNKKTTGAFAVGYGNTSIKSIDEIKKLELKLTMYEESFSKALMTTDNIAINLD